MKTKSLSLVALSTLILFLFAGLVSAEFTVSTNSIIFTPSDTSKTFVVTNTNNTQLLNIVIQDSITIDGIVFNITGDRTSINASLPRTFTITPQQTIDMNFGESFSAILNISDSSNPLISHPITLKLEDKNFCEFNNVGNDLVLDVEINNVKGFGEEDDEWYLLDEIEVEVNVENRGDEDINNIEVSWGLYDPDNNEWIIEESEKDFDLKDGDEEKVTITFQIDPKDINDESQENYIFFVKATGETEDTGLDTCASENQTTTLFIDDDFVILEDISLTPEISQCGSEVEVTANVWNIGADDQNEVSVMIYNPSLGLNNQKIEIGDIDSLDKEKLIFKFNIPENANEKTYTIELRVLDDNDDIYENDNDDQSVFTPSLKVEGSCGIKSGSVLVAAVLESGGKAGENLVVKATVTNTGNKLQTFSLKSSGYSGWASSANFDESTLALGAGESKDVLITLNVNQDASGDKTFNIEVLSGEQLIISQPVSVSIEKSGFSFGGISGITADNWYLWAIGALNIILVIIIIIVAVRVAKS